MPQRDTLWHMVAGKHRNLSIRLGDEEMEIITHLAADLGISHGAAVRYLIRKGAASMNTANGPTTQPLTPKEPT